MKTFRLLLDADAKGAVAALDHMGAAAQKAQASSTKSLDKISSGLTTVGTVGIAAAIAGGGALAKLSNNFEHLAIDANKMSIATGLTVEAASRWIEVSSDLGVETATVEGALGKLNKAAQTTPALFDKIGAEIVRTKGGAVDVNATFLKTVDALNAIKNPAERQVAAAALLGKGWQSMANIIGEGSANLKASLADVAGAKVVDPSGVATAKEYRAELDHLTDSVEELGLAIGKGAAPLIGRLADGLGATVDLLGKADVVTGGAAGQFLALTTAGVGLVGTLSLVAGQTIKMRDRFTDAEGALTGFGTAAKYTAVGLAAVATAMVGVDIANKLTADTDKGTEAMQRLAVALDDIKTQGKQPGEVLAAVVKASNELEESKGGVQKFFDVFSHGDAHLSDTQLRVIKETIDNITKDSPEMGQQISDALMAAKIAADAGDQSIRHYLDTMGLTDSAIDEIVAKQKLASSSANALTGSTDDAASSLDTYAGSALNAAAVTEQIYLGLLDAAGAAEKARVADQKMGDTSDEVAKNLQHEIDVVDKLRTALENRTSAALDANGAALDAADADLRVSDAIAKYNEMLHGTPPKLEDVARAQDKLTAAKEKYNDTLKVTPATDLDKEKALVALQEAQLAYNDAVAHPGKSDHPDLDRRKATVALTEAQMAYDKVIKGSSATADEQAAALKDVTDAQAEYDATTRTVIHSEGEKKQAYIDVQRAINDSAAAHANEQEILKKEAGLSWNVRDSLDAQITSLGNIEKTLDPNGPVAKAIDAHIQQLKDQASAADAALAALNRYFDNSPAGAASYVDPAGSSVPTFASGGIVPGPVGRPLLALVHGGEMVTPVGAPRVPQTAGAWSGGGGGTVNHYWTVNVPPTADQASVGRAIEEARRAWLRAGGKAA